MTTIDTQTITANEFPLTVSVRAHELRSDVKESTGGHDSAPGPHDFFDMALATCKAATAMWYAKRHGIPLERVESHVDSDDSEERAGVYRFRVRVELFGPMTDEQRSQLQRAVSTCPIHKLMTTADVQIEMI